MAEVRIILSGLWVALMLTYLLGDVLRLFAGDITPGEIDGQQATQAMWMGAAVIMLVPIAMVVLSLTLPYPRFAGSASPSPSLPSCSISSACRTTVGMTTS